MSGERLCKTDEYDFMNAINKCDLFCLTETHCSDSDCPSVQGFKLFMNNRIKHPKAWRPSGGIAVYIRKSIAKGVKIVNSSCSELTCIKLCKDFFHLTDDMY